MTTNTPSGPRLANSTPQLSADFVEVMKQWQGLEKDLIALRDHLMRPIPQAGVGARVCAAMLTAAVLEEKLVRMQITAMVEAGGR
jgi:hypothetical protein